MGRSVSARKPRDPDPNSGLVQLDFDQWIDKLADHDAARPARNVLWCLLALLGLGFLLQVGHAANLAEPDEYAAVMRTEVRDRGLAVLAVLFGMRLGLARVRQWTPAAVLVALALLIGVLLFAEPVNGSKRWLNIGLSVQPSELARIALVLWVAHTAVLLGARITTLRGMLRVFLPALAICLPVLMQPDKGGFGVMFVCACATMWIGGVDSGKVALPFFALVTGALALTMSDPYSRNRLDMWLGDVQNEQVEQGLTALANAGVSGRGLGFGELRERGVPYMDSDYVFALVGEELGWFGLALVLGLFAGLFWNGFRTVLSLKDRFEAVAASGLFLSVGLQTLVHLGSVCGLFPPKGMTLPFLSDGGTSLLVSSLGVGLALGAARQTSDSSESCSPSNATA